LKDTGYSSVKGWRIHNTAEERVEGYRIQQCKGLEDTGYSSVKG